MQHQKLCSTETSLSGADVNSSGTCVYSSGTGPDTESQGGSAEERKKKGSPCKFIMLMNLFTCAFGLRVYLISVFDFLLIEISLKGI